MGSWRAQSRGPTLPTRLALDGGRSPRTDSKVRRRDESFILHIDLHETTDSDEEEFRPALAARDGKAFEPGTIPDGFYMVADAELPQPDFQATIIAAVQKLTHIAPADDTGQIIGAPLQQAGVIEYPYRKLGLCAGLT